MDLQLLQLRSQTSWNQSFQKAPQDCQTNEIFQPKKLENSFIDSAFSAFYENSIHKFALLNQSSQLFIAETKDIFMKKLTIKDQDGSGKFKEIIVSKADEIEDILIFGNDQYIALQSCKDDQFKVYVHNIQQFFDAYSISNSFQVPEKDLISVRKNYLRKFTHPTAKQMKLFADEYILFYSDDFIDAQSFTNLMSFEQNDAVKVKFELEQKGKKDNKNQNKKLAWSIRVFSQNWLFGVSFNQTFEVINICDGKIYLGFDTSIQILNIDTQLQNWNVGSKMSKRNDFIQNSNIPYKLNDKNKAFVILQENTVTKKNESISIEGFNSRYNLIEENNMQPVLQDNIIFYVGKDKINKSIDLVMIDVNTLHIINRISVEGLILHISFCQTTKQIFISLEKEIKVIKPFFSSFFPQNYVKIPGKTAFQGVSNNKIIFRSTQQREMIIVNPVNQDNIEIINVNDGIKSNNKNKIDYYKQFQLFNNNTEVIFAAKNFLQEEGTYIAQFSSTGIQIPLKIDSCIDTIFSVRLHNKMVRDKEAFSQIYCIRGNRIDLITYSYQSQESTVKQIIDFEESLKYYVLLYQSIDDSSMYAFIDFQNRRGRHAQIYQILDEKANLYCELEDVWTYTFNNNYDIMFIFTNFRKLVAYDLLKKQYISSFETEIPKQNGMIVDLSYNNDKNILAVVTGKELMIRIFYLDVNQNQQLYIKYSLFLNFKHDSHNYIIDRSVKDQQYRKAKYLQFFTQINETDYQSKSLLSIDYFIEEQSVKYPFLIEPFYKNGLQEQNILFDSVEVNMATQTYQFQSDIDNQPIGFIQQFQITDDFQKFSRLNQLNDIDLINELKQNSNKLNLYFMYYPLTGNLFNLVAKRARVLEYLAQALSMKQKADIPILMLISNQKSPLDIAINANDIKSVILLLEIIVKFQNNHVFNYLVDKNLISLIEMQINLDDYFESHLPMIKLLNQNYPDLHIDDQELIVAVPQIKNPKEILDNYDQILANLLQKEQSVHENEKLTPIEYFLINLPETLTKKPRELMQVLSQSENIEVFEYLAVQTIIDFKWNQYTKSFFKKQFFIFLVFCFSFLFEVMYTLTYQNRREDPIIDDRNPTVLYSFKAVSLIVLSYFFVYELKQALIQKGYIMEIWNIFDYSLIISYLAEIIFEELTPSSDAIVITKILIVTLIFLKICFFLRIYNGFSFLVSMMAAVFIDLKYFLAFFVVFILQFGIIFAILFDATAIEEYNGIGIFSYFMMAFRTSSGDFNVDSYKDQSQILVIISWTIWIIAVMILNVMFMNFIIAVISESYEKVMQKLTAESYRVKVQMIVERELHFTNQELKLNKFFPQYLLLRKPITSNLDQKGEWQGFVKDIKNTIKFAASRQRTDLKQSQKNIDKQFIDSNSKISELASQFSSNFKGQDIQSEKKFAELEKNISSIIDQKFTKINQISTLTNLDLELKFDQINEKLLDQDKKIENIDVSLKSFIQEQREKYDSIQALNATIQELIKKLN
eukprot:403335266